MCQLKVNNKPLSAQPLEIVKEIKNILHNGKLAVIKEMGDNIRITCPCSDHKDGRESKPSASIYIGENDELEFGWYRCFTCNTQGPFSRFVAECFECSEDKAKEWLLENYGMETDEVELDLPEISLKPKSSQKYLNPKMLESFQSFHPYLTKRKLSKHICELFDVKYDPKSKSVVFPVYDEKHKLVMLTRRSVENKTFIIDKDKEKPLYLLYYLLEHNIQEAIVTEGQIDCLTCYEYGFPAIATMGSPSEHQIELLNKSGLRVIYTMFDNDEAGKRFTQNVTKKLRKDIIVINVDIPIKGKKDINDLTQNEFNYCLNLAESKISIV